LYTFHVSEPQCLVDRGDFFPFDPRGKTHMHTHTHTHTHMCTHKHRHICTDIQTHAFPHHKSCGTDIFPRTPQLKSGKVSPDASTAQRILDDRCATVCKPLSFCLLWTLRAKPLFVPALISGPRTLPQAHWPQPLNMPPPPLGFEANGNKA
jgi:hypothetical protein